jgi:hypothetical protein
MSGYVPYQLPDGNDPDQILLRMLQQFAATVPGWVPREGHPEVALLEAAANMAAEDRALIASVSAAVFGHFGESLILLPRLRGTAATATAVFNLADANGHTIPAGTQLLWDDGAGGGMTLTTVDDVIVPVGQSVAAAVAVTADTLGSDGNRITTGPVQVVDALSFVSTAALTIGAAGGVDDETDSDYLDRLAEYLTHFGATAVTAADFAALARNIPGVDRAIAIDGWQVAGDTLGNEKTVGVVVVDAAGQALSAATKTAVDAYLQSLREINFLITVTDPTYTTLTVVFTATARPGRNAADVKANAEAAALAYLSPATWGTDAGAHTWNLDNVVSYLTLAGEIRAADGVDRLTALTVNGGTSDVTLTGRVGLPGPATTAVGTVT